MTATVTVNPTGIIRVPKELCAEAGFRPREFPIAFGWADRSGRVFRREQAEHYPFVQAFMHSIQKDGSLTLDMAESFGLTRDDPVELEAKPGEIVVRSVLEMEVEV